MRSSRGRFLPLNSNQGRKTPFPEITSTDSGETGTFSGTVNIKSFTLGFVLQTGVILDQGFPGAASDRSRKRKEGRFSGSGLRQYVVVLGGGCCVLGIPAPARLPVPGCGIFL
jgi:hypothetical protein